MEVGKRHLKVNCRTMMLSSAKTTFNFMALYEGKYSAGRKSELWDFPWFQNISFFLWCLPFHWLVCVQQKVFAFTTLKVAWMERKENKNKFCTEMREAGCFMKQI